MVLLGVLSHECAYDDTKGVKLALSNLFFRDMIGCLAYPLAVGGAPDKYPRDKRRCLIDKVLR